MKLTKETFDIMQNFTAINNSIWVVEPNCLKTISIAENIIGIYDTEETWTKWQLYNSVSFMSLISLYELEKIDLDFGEKSVVIKTPGTRATIMYNPVELIPKFDKLKDSANYKKYDNFNATFSLTSEKISQIQKAANILGLPDMDIKMEDGKGLVVLRDEENPDSNHVKVGITGEGTCDIKVMVKNLQIVSGDYDISVSNGVLAKFKNTKQPLFYIVAAKKG